jgi:DNA-binding CsgD family transcriptional regulator
MRRQDAQRAEREVAHLASAGLDWSALSLHAGEAVRRAMPYDHACWHTVDPASLLFTGVTKDSLEDETRLPYHEYALSDVNQWADLARGPQVGILSEATGGAPEVSPRFRELLRPRGIAAELRAVFSAGGTAWGACGIYRDRHRPDFTPAEARLLARVGRLLADGYRRSLLLAGAGLGAAGGAAPAPGGPGVVLLDGHGAVEAMDPVAREHLAAVGDRTPGPRADVPAVVRAVAQRARRGEARPARARVRRRDGGWVVLHGTRLPGTGRPEGSGERLAVLVEVARPAELWPLVADAYGLTGRERDITLLCLRGLSTAEMSRALHLSPYTLQDHLKGVFAKVGVRARRALVARIFLDCYWEPVATGTTPAARGGFPGG